MDVIVTNEATIVHALSCLWRRILNVRIWYSDDSRGIPLVTQDHASAVTIVTIRIDKQLTIPKH